MSPFVISRRDLLRGAVTLAGSSILGAQDATFSTGISVVNVLVGVRDKDGRIVRDLAKDDFKLEEDGRKQVIQYFSHQTDLPLTLGMMIDTSGSQRFVLAEERAASRLFIRRILREDRDLAFVIHFDSEVELLQDVTSSKKALEAALDDLQMPEPRMARRGGGGGRGRGPVGTGPAGTALYDSILLACDELMRQQSGRKALIVLTDGVDQGSKVSLNAAIEAAQRADTMVYSILFSGTGGNSRFSVVLGGPPRPPMGGPGAGVPMPPPVASVPNGGRIMRKMSEQTGGSFFEVSDKVSLDDIFTQIEQELRNQYNLGFTPVQPGKGFRKLKVTVARKGLKIQARDGYYAD